MKSVYWEDGYDDHGVFAGNAQQFAEFIIRGIQEWFEVTQHAICNVHMELEGSVAHTEAYLIAYHKIAATPAKVEGWFGENYLRRYAPRWRPVSPRTSSTAVAMSTGWKSAAASGGSPSAPW